MTKLSCWSFHSVKGGVGKSTLATLTAVQLANDHPDDTVWLVDMDLTGTSLADVLPLRAPRCARSADGEALDLEHPAESFLDPPDIESALSDRDEDESGRPIGVPFLNDYLLYATEDWDEEHDVNIDALAWQPHGQSSPSNLRVLPSSALPRDLDRILPVIFDEEHAGFLENRLEYLLSAMLGERRTTHVVFDVPPTIPGLSRAVLSLALRLGRGTKTPLSLDGFFPDLLEEAALSWCAVMIATTDLQDIRALTRWLDRVKPDEEAVFRVLINRTQRTDEGERQQWLEELTAGGLLNRLLSRTQWLSASPAFELFRRSEFPHPHPRIADLLRKLEGT